MPEDLNKLRRIPLRLRGSPIEAPPRLARLPAKKPALPEIDALSTVKFLALPHLACVAFATRCARRVLDLCRLVGRDRIHSAGAALLEQIEECTTNAAAASPDIDLEIAILMEWEYIYNDYTSFSSAQISAGAAQAVQLAKGAYVGADSVTVAANAAQAARISLETIYDYLEARDCWTPRLEDPSERQERYNRFFDEMQRDYDLLLRVAREETWADDDRLPHHFWSQYAEICADETLADPSTAELLSAFDAELISYFSRHPERMHDLQPAEFEDLVAEVLHGLGFSVELTRRTRDGGYDLIAISEEIVRLKLLVECKRYRPDRKVGVELVRQLHGVVSGLEATKGVLVTTSTFTSGALAHLSQHRWLLDGRDMDGLLQWIRLYELRRMAAMYEINH